LHESREFGGKAFIVFAQFGEHRVLTFGIEIEQFAERRARLTAWIGSNMMRVILEASS